MLLMQSAAVTSQSTTRDYGQDSQWTNGFGAGCKGLKTSTCGNKCGWLHLPFCFPLQLGQECHVGIVPTAKAAAVMLTVQGLFPWPCCTCHMVGQRGQSKLDNVLQHTQETPMMSLQSNLKGANMREWVETVVRVIHRQDVKSHFVEASTKHGCTRTQLNN